MYITPPIQLPLTSEARLNKANSPFNLTFKGLPKFEPDVFELRPDFNRTQQQNQQKLNVNLRPGGGLDYWA
jgi:hypothetical protein